MIKKNKTSVTSVTVEIAPQDVRCRFWAKIITSEDLADLIPAQISGASDIPGDFAVQGDDELWEGRFLIAGEAEHHRKNQGWSYYLAWMDPEGTLREVTPTRETKKKLKGAGMARELLAGSGQLAACVRLAIGITEGMYS